MTCSVLYIQDNIDKLNRHLMYTLLSSVADPDPFDTDPDPAFQFDMDPDLTV